MDKALLTVVIPTRHRLPFLERAVRYYQEVPLPYPLLIVDSSELEVRNRTAAMLDRVGGGLRIAHRPWPVGGSLLTKMCGISAEVRTPYVAMAADDDFLVAERLRASVAWLQLHLDYSLVHGAAVLVSLASGTTHGPVAWTARYPQPTLIKERASERLLAHLADYRATWYSVQRTAEWAANLQAAAPLESDMHFGELLTSCLSVVRGKVHSLEGLYMVRQSHAAQDSAGGSGFRDLFDWVTDPGWPARYAHLRDRLAEALAHADGMSLDASRDIVKRGFWSRLGPLLVNKWQGRYGKRQGKRIPRLREALTRVPGARWAFRVTKAIVGYGEDELPLEVLLEPSGRYAKAFLPIYRALTDGASAGKAPSEAAPSEAAPSDAAPAAAVAGVAGMVGDG